MNTSTRNLRAKLARLWSLRLYQLHLAGTGPFDTYLLDAIRCGLRRWRACVPDDADVPTLRAKVAAMLKRHGAPAIGDDPLFADLARIFSLDTDATLVLAFFCLQQNDEVLSAATRDEKRYAAHRHGMQKLLRDVLGLSMNRVRRAVSWRGALLSSGLFSICTGGYSYATDIVEINDSVLNMFADEASDASSYLGQLLEKAAPAELSLQDYAHVATDVARIKRLLDAAMRDRAGANILLYGLPGTGKSQLAHALAQALDAELFLVRTADADGEPIEGAQRLIAFQTAQRVLASQSRALVLFDEIEDVFRHSDHAARGAVNFKSWINRQLEISRVPSLWIGNSLASIDDSQLRRFDVVVELAPPPRSARRAMLERQLNHLNVSAELVDGIAARSDVTPAHYARAVRLLQRLQPHGNDDVSGVVRDSLNEVLHARRRPLLGRTSRAPAFDASLVHTDQPIAPIVNLLRRRPSARLCLYGPPGTGKTALAAHLAECIDRPLLKRRASELLGPYIGDTEQAIAQMFREAEREDAVLCLDEADSFLRDRKEAHHRWEVTQVNELLTRLEDFDGVFVASTNLMDQLDAAALRRFDFKLRFQWLDVAQRRALLARYVEQFQLRPNVSEHERVRELTALDCLAPGDFAALARRIEATEHCGEREVLNWLREEQALKPGMGRARIGFVS